MRVLRAEYENGNQTFVDQIDWLVEKGYKGIRRTRGDGTSIGFHYDLSISQIHDFISHIGDCFYRCTSQSYESAMKPSQTQSINC